MEKLNQLNNENSNKGSSSHRIKNAIIHIIPTYTLYDITIMEIIKVVNVTAKLVKILR